MGAASPTWIIPLIAALLTGTATAAAITAVSQRRKTSAEAAKTTAEAIATEAQGDESTAKAAQLIVTTAAELVGLSNVQLEGIARDRAADIERFETRIREVEHEFNKRIKRLEEERTQLRLELETERKAKETLQEENRQLREAHAAVTERVRNLEEELKALQAFPGNS